MHKKFLFVLVLFASVVSLTGGGGAFGASVTVKNTPLSEITDIVKTATNNDLTIQKHSLMFVERFSNNGKIRFLPHIVTINSDGSVNKEYQLEAYDVDKLDDDQAMNRQMYLATSKEGMAKKRNIMLASPAFPDGSSMYGVMSITSDIAKESAAISDKSYQFANDDYSKNIWGTGHLQIKGLDKDVFVYASCNKKPGEILEDKKDMWGLPIHKDSDPSIVYLSFVAADDKDTGSINLQSLKVGNDDLFEAFKTEQSTYGSVAKTNIYGVSITTGDLDDDGYKNEVFLAVAADDGLKVFIYSVSSPDGSSLKLNRIKTYDLPLSRKASNLIALTGDFDGDGKDEAVLIYKGVYAYVAAIFKFIDVNNWLLGSTPINAPTYNMVWLKAAKADLDGDGKDEIAIFALLNETSYGTAHQYTPYLTTVYCQGVYSDQEYISLLQDRDHSRGARNRYAILGYNIYSNSEFTSEEDFTITAGPLTGTKGKFKLVDDIVLSHVSQNYKGVFLIPTQTDASNNFAGFGDTKTIYRDSSGFETYDNKSDKYRGCALITADFTGESLLLDTPSHTVSPEDLSFLSVIQAFPYHVDNVAEDGMSLTDHPVNFTFSALGGDGQMSAQYQTTATQSESSDAKFHLESTTETIIGVDKLGNSMGIDNLGTYARGYLKFHQMQANIAADIVPEAKPVAGVMNKVMELVTDKIEKTEDEVNKTASSTTVTNSKTAYTHDNVVTYSAPQHIWRYRVLNDPLPTWFAMGDRVDQNDDFGTLNTANGNRYITFSIYDGYRKTDGDSLNTQEYQPTHEEGNLFSYPSRLIDIEGYNSNGELLETAPSYRWGTGSETYTDLTFQKTTTNTTQSTEKVTESELSKAISVVGGWFGNDNPLDLPPYTSSTSTFSKTYTTTEEIKIGLQGSSGLPEQAAGHTLMYMPYITKEGTMKFGTAVTLDNSSSSGNYQTLWKADSIYNRYADPSLVLPMKFTRDTGTKFKTSTNDLTATKLRGMRFYMPDLALKTDNKLVKGIPYKIKVPIYNASFKDAANVEVRLSYVPAASFKANMYNVAKTVIGTATITSLGGWKNDTKNNKEWAEFDYTFPVNDANLKSGAYEFYVEIDPDNKISEVHESRFEKSTANKILDVGGNNEGHFPFELWGFDDKAPTQAKASAASGGLVYSSAYDVRNAGKVRASYGTYDTTNTVAVHVTFDGDETTQTIHDKLQEQAAIDPDIVVPIDVEMEFMEDEESGAYPSAAYPEVIFFAYLVDFSDEAINNRLERLQNMTDEELKEYLEARAQDRVNHGFFRYNTSLFSGETTKFTMYLKPSAVLVDEDHFPVFELYIPALAPEVSVASADAEPEGRDWGDYQAEVESGDNTSDDAAPIGSSSGGCDAGFAVSGLVAMLIFVRKLRK